MNEDWHSMDEEPKKEGIYIAYAHGREYFTRFENGLWYMGYGVTGDESLELALRTRDTYGGFLRWKFAKGISPKQQKLFN